MKEKRPMCKENRYFLLPFDPSRGLSLPSSLTKLAALRQNLSRDELDNYKKFKDNPSQATEAISDDDGILEGATSRKTFLKQFFLK